MLQNATLTVPGDKDTTLQYAASHFVTLARDAIEDHDFFAVALSGGSTPKAIYELICAPGLAEEIEWEKVHLFWSDERSVPPDHPDSNYRMAMEAGFKKMPIPPGHIHRMIAENDIEKNALAYEKTLRRILEDQALDLVMLGMGEDGHTASLFPGTAALKAQGRLCVSNYIPEKKTERMTLTFECINAAAHVAVYVLGSNKKEMLHHVFNSPPKLPCQQVGTVDNPALWIADEAAGV
ncbi:MAG: 6-phosphogluconolactonase [Verrucomicrobia bacterium]|nr:6-phosphogluconolactonase [Verrucomicrobiota bacterium]